MANVTITQLPAAGPITGTESVPIVQNGQTVQTTTGAIAASPSQNQTFLTLNNEPTLPNSRYLSTGTGLGLNDGGAQSDLEIILNGASGSLEAAGNGVIVKTGSTTVTARTISTSGAGLTVSNGNGVSGNPTIALDGLPASLANMSGTGILGVVGGSSITSMVITGTSNQITVANGAGPGNPTLALASDPVIPGTGAMVVPKGTTAERPGGVDGMLRFNTDTDAFEIYDSGGWDTLPAGAITLINTGTGLTGGPITSSGTISIANTGVTAATYGSASAVPQVAINAQGQVTSASDVSIAIAASQVTSGSFDITQGAVGLTSYTAGDLVYYVSGTTLTNLAIGSSTYVMTSSGSAPQWTDPATITVGTASSATTATTATNLAAGAANEIPYQTGAGATSFVTAPTVASTVLQWSGSAFQWASVGTGSVTSVDVSGGTTGLTTSGGPITGSGTITIAGTLITSNGGTGLTTYTAGDLVYYSTGTALSKLGIGSSTYILTSSGTAPQWSDPSGITVGAATTATTATTATNATNIAITDNTSSASTYYPVISLNTTGDNAATVSSTKLSFVPSTGVLSATGFSGALNGTVGATTPNAGTFTTLTANTVSEFGRSSANYWQAIGAATTLTPEFATLGSDTNISATFRSKGTGAINFAGGSGGVNISNGGTVTAITATVSGSSYTSIPSVAISAPTTTNGVQATADALMFTSTATVASGGTGYTNGDVLTIVGGSRIGGAVGTYTVTGVSGGVITSVSRTSGSGYSVLPTNPVSTTGGTGSGATLNIIWVVSGLNITNAGSGYVEQPTVTFSGGGGSGAAAYAVVGSVPTIRSLASSVSFVTSAGENLRLADAGSNNLTDYVEVRGGSSVAGAYIGVNGVTSTANLYVSAKSGGAVRFFTNGQGVLEQFRVAHTTSAVNYVQVTGAATGGQPNITVQGSDSAIGLTYRTKGNFNHQFQNGSFQIGFEVAPVGSGANYVRATSAIAGAAPVLSAQGSDTNIDLALTPKGTGMVTTAAAIVATGGISGGTF